MRTYDLIFSAGEIKEFTLTAAFFLLLEDGGTNINIEVATTGGNYSLISDVGAGFGFRAPHDEGLSSYTNLRFFSPVAQTVKFYAGNSDAVYNRLGGVVNVSGLVDVNLKGATYTQNYFSQLQMSANTPHTVLSPALNINGVNLVSWHAISSNLTGVSATVLIAKSSPPVNVGDGAVLHGLVDNVVSVGSQFFMSGSIRSPIFVPAGNGLYAISSVAESGAFRSALIDVL